MRPRQAFAWFGHRVRESRLHLHRWWTPDRELRVLILPGPFGPGASSHLRGWALAAAMREIGIRAFCLPDQIEMTQRKRVLRLERPHVVIHQKLRRKAHRPWLYPQAINVLDMDDADFIDPVLGDEYSSIVSRFDAAVAGSRFTHDWLQQFCPTVETIWTGSPLTKHVPKSRPSQRQAIVGWATSNLSGYPREAAFVRDVVLAAAREVKFSLRLQGGGDVAAVRELFAPVREAGIKIEYSGFRPYRSFIRSLESLAVGLAPLVVENEADQPLARNRFSAGKSFGKVLGYLAAGVPIVAANTADHPLFFRDGENGYLPDSPQAWSHRIVHLIRHPSARDVLAAAASRDFKAQLSTEAAARAWADLLARLVTEANAGPAASPETAMAAS